MGHYSVAASRRLGIPLVTTFYGRDLTVGETDPRWNARYEELFADGAAFICEGPAMASHLAAVGCPESKIHLARIGLDIAALPFEPSRSRGPLRILQTARFVEKKGIDLSIRALALVREQYADAELLLIGDGPERAKLESLTAELGLDGAVRFLGGASHAEYRQALAQAHMLIQPSRTASDGDTEGGAPTVLIEAQAMGLPVVTTRHADIPFVVADPGRMADEEDVEGIARIVVQTAELSDPEREAAARSARASVEANHDATSIARVHQTIYERALEGASTGSRAAG
jgi:colanic acid/amylovoran biosynthesis glycosyltransferase